MSQLSDFLQENELTPEQVIAESRVTERLDRSAREAYVKRADARRNKKPYAEVGAQKPDGLRRGVSRRTLQLALHGEPITRINRKKITRAVHNLLKGEQEVTVFRLFGDTRSRNHKKPEASED